MMDFSTARNERTIAIVSTLVAIAILAGGVTAFQSQDAPVDDVVQLESDFRFQLEVAFLHNPNERVRRLMLLNEISDAWQQSTRTPTDREKLADWLLESTIRSMAGSIEALPTIPRFSGQGQQSATAPASAESTRPSELTVKTGPLARVATEAVGTVSASTPDSSVSPERAKPTAISVETLVIPGPTVVAPRVVESPIRINLIELAARIAGYHEGLDEIEQSLLDFEGENIPKLAALVQQLDGLAHSYRFVKLYHQLLTDKERQTIDSPRPMTATFAEIERRIDRTLASQAGDFLGEFDTDNQDQIAGLRQLLSAVANRIDR